MKTPNDTKEVAGLIQSFLRERGITVARCDALELASRLKGRRDLHEDQATVAPTSNAGDNAIEVPQGAFVSYFKTLAFMLQNSLSYTESLQAVNSLPFPAPVLALGEYIAKRHATGVTFAEACRDAQLPPAYLTLLFSCENHSPHPWRGIEQVTKFIQELQNIGASVPPIVFHRESPVFSYMRTILALDPDPVPNSPSVPNSA